MIRASIAIAGAVLAPGASGAQARAVHSGLCFLAGLGMAVCILSGCAPLQYGDAAPTISVEKSTYAPGENIGVTYSNGPGNITDWIAIYVDGENTEGGDNDPNLKGLVLHQWYSRCWGKRCQQRPCGVRQRCRKRRKRGA